SRKPPSTWSAPSKRRSRRARSSRRKRRNYPPHEGERGASLMATFHFDLVSPEKLLFSGEVDQVDIPGTEGDFGVLAGHAPLVSALRPGIMTVTVNGQAQRMVVLGGFAE